MSLFTELFLLAPTKILCLLISRIGAVWPEVNFYPCYTTEIETCTGRKSIFKLCFLRYELIIQEVIVISFPYCIRTHLFHDPSILLSGKYFHVIVVKICLSRNYNLKDRRRTSLNSATCFWENIEKTLEPVRLALRLPRDDCLSLPPPDAGAGAAAGASSAGASSFAFFFFTFLSLSA